MAQRFQWRRRLYLPRAHIFADAETIPAAREVWWKLIRAYDENRMSSAKYQDLNTGFKTLLGYLIAERGEDLVVRVQRIEERLTILQNRG